MKTRSILATLLFSTSCATVGGAINMAPRVATCRLLSGDTGGQIAPKTYWCSKRVPEQRWTTIRAEAIRAFAPDAFAELDNVTMWIVDAKQDAEYAGLYTGRNESPPAFFLYIRPTDPDTALHWIPVIVHELGHAREHLSVGTSFEENQAALQGADHFADLPEYHRRERKARNCLIREQNCD